VEQYARKCRNLSLHTDKRANTSELQAHTAQQPDLD